MRKRQNAHQHGACRDNHVCETVAHLVGEDRRVARTEMIGLLGESSIVSVPGDTRMA